MLAFPVTAVVGEKGVGRLVLPQSYCGTPTADVSVANITCSGLWMVTRGIITELLLSTPPKEKAAWSSHVPYISSVILRVGTSTARRWKEKQNKKTKTNQNQLQTFTASVGVSTSLSWCSLGSQPGKHQTWKLAIVLRIRMRNLCPLIAAHSVANN